MRTFKSFRIKLPSGGRYWTVIDGSYRPVQGVDDWLLHLRVGRDCAESTTESYAGALALFPEWCGSIGRDWRTTAGEFGRFVYWLQRYDADSAPDTVPGVVRGPRRVNVVLAAVRVYFRHAAALGEIDDSVLSILFDVVDDFALPREVRSGPQMRMRTKPRHRLSEPQRVVDAVTGDEILSLLGACRNARDRFIVLALWRIGHRRGELTGMRIEDVHLSPTRLGSAAVCAANTCRSAGGRTPTAQQPSRAVPVWCRWIG